MIKFKATTTSGQWVEGDYWIERFKKNKPIHWIIITWTDEDGLYHQRSHEVIPETVCVGFDIKGRTIFHGDKVKHNDKEFIAVLTENAGFVLIENNDSFGNILNDKLMRVKHNHRNQLWMYNVSKYLKITGNIHDHLLVQKTEKECKPL